VRVAIVGGGISGLTAAHVALGRGHDVVVVDEAPGPGGLVATARRDGFLCERGPQALLDGPEETRALIAAAGLADRVVAATPAARRRFVYVDGALRPFPTNPRELFKSDLFTLKGKMRLLREPFIGRGKDEEESVFDFIARRFGHEAARRAGAPAIIGVYAGDAAALSAASALPRLVALERESGSVLRGMMQRRTRVAMGRPVSFPDGLGELPAALAAALGQRRTVARAEAIAPVTQGSNAGGWQISLAGGATVEAERLVLATPAAATALLLAPHAPEAADALRTIPHAPVAVVSLGFRNGGNLGIDLDAYGFVAARGERIRLLGCQYESSVFPDRAPAGGVLIRALIGGTFAPAVVDGPEAVIAGEAVFDLRRAAGLRRDPDFVDVWRVRPGIPQYDRGHAARLAAADDAIGKLPGLTVIGHALRGVGLGDCIRAATAAAASIG
jgi:oxygen-dependent protoporphyrinogen oxidase